jgi:hypothetical protein
MSGQDFMRIVRDAFVPFLMRLGFSMENPSISGRFYRASFTSPKHAVSVSYEPGDNALFVMVFSRENGHQSSIDDRIRTPRLSDLNSRYMHTITEEERSNNELMFPSTPIRDDEERLLLKSAKELSLVLPKYLSDRNPAADAGT